MKAKPSNSVTLRYSPEFGWKNSDDKEGYTVLFHIIGLVSFEKNTGNRRSVMSSDSVDILSLRERKNTVRVLFAFCKDKNNKNRIEGDLLTFHGLQKAMYAKSGVWSEYKEREICKKCAKNLDDLNTQLQGLLSLMI